MDDSLQKEKGRKMNTTSLLITLVGIIIIVGLYLMSRLALSKQPKIQKINIPNLKNSDGSKLSSVVEDIAAQDGSTPKPEPEPLNKISMSNKVENQSTTPKHKEKEKEPQQIILFISSNNQNGLDGNLIAKTLQENNLTLGDKDIYHYFIDKNASKTSLFRVANGTAPWTLNKTDLINKKLAGLSLFMSLPKRIERKEAIETLLQVSKNIAKEINGTLKNDKQQPLTQSDEEILKTL